MTPGCKNLVLPRACRCNDFRRLWPTQEDQIQTSAQVIGLQRMPYRGRDLKGRFAQANACERNGCR